MGKLHEVLAVEEDRKGQAKKILLEADKTFKNKQGHFEENIQVFKPLAEGAEDITEAHTPMVTTVEDKLEYVADVVAKYLDVAYQKENANTEAFADVVLDDGTVLLEKVPATALLGLERELKNIADVYSSIPTLEPGFLWSSDETTGNYKTYSRRDRTKKEIQFKTIAQATKEHPAQVAQISQDVVTGVIEHTKLSSKFTSSHKSELLDRLDELKRAVKKARMRANSVEVQTVKVGKKLFNYINKGLK